MPGLILANSTDVLDLDSVHKDGTGVQVTSGVSGLGLPPVALQWVEGAGDGATLRGRRVLPRNIDLPLMVQGADRDELKVLMRRLSLMLAGPCTLSFVEEGGEAWSTEVVRVGGGTYDYGLDTTGERDLFTVVTMRAGDPFFTSNVTNTATIRKFTGRGLLPKLGNLRLTSEMAFGSVVLDNTGTTGAYPVWTVEGPGSNFTAISPTGETLIWNGTIGVDDTLTFDFRKGTVVDQTGANRYAELAPAPRFWQIPPGLSSCTASMDDTTVDTAMTLEWRPRAWVVI
jgi:hypothetical protein